MILIRPAAGSTLAHRRSPIAKDFAVHAACLTLEVQILVAAHVQLLILVQDPVQPTVSDSVTHRLTSLLIL